MPDRTSVDPAANLKERLREVASNAGSHAAFAKSAGIPLDTFNKYLSGTQPSPAALIKIADAADVTIDYLVGRTNVSLLAASGTDDLVSNVFGLRPSDLATGRNLATDLAGFVPIPRFEIRASAGGGQLALPEDPTPEIMMLRENWLRSIGVAPRNAEFLEATGDSMQDTIFDGDLLLIDRGYGEVVNGKIYVLVVSNLIVVKRLQVLTFGGLLLISDNPKYKEEIVKQSEMDDLQIQGRVAWYGRAI